MSSLELPQGSSNYDTATSASPVASTSQLPAVTHVPAKKDKKSTVGPKTKSNVNPLPSRADEVTYRTKYRQLREKVAEIEDGNAEIHASILRTKRQIQRLRLERSILYERFMEAKSQGLLDKTDVPLSSVTPILHGARPPTEDTPSRPDPSYRYSTKMPNHSENPPQASHNPYEEPHYVDEKHVATSPGLVQPPIYPALEQPPEMLIEQSHLPQDQLQYPVPSSSVHAQHNGSQAANEASKSSGRVGDEEMTAG